MFRKYLAVAVMISMALARSAWAVEDADCFGCHGDANLKDDKGRSLYVDKTVYEASIHKENGCVSCHKDITDVPHEADLKPVSCGECHSEAEEYAKSLHGQELSKGDTDVATCLSCHGKHDIRPVSDPLSPMYPTKQPDTCAKCHSNPALEKKHMISVRDPSESYKKSIHAKQIAAGNLNAPTCTACHGAHTMLASLDPNSTVNRQNLQKTCSKCHEQEAGEYAESIHGAALAKGIKDAPTCFDCHGEHSIEAPEEADSTVNRQQVSRSTCPRCHDNSRVMDKYGIESTRSASYMDSYHGMASAAGSEVVASCTSCHGVHTILPADNPKSSIHPGNLVETCKKCHKDANENFAKGKVHVIDTDKNQLALLIVRIVYLVLIAGTVGGMIFHNSLIMGRHMLSKFFEELRGEHTYRRFNTGQTIGHLVLTVSFITLAVTGFALRYPDMWWVKLFFVGDQGLALRGTIHRGAGVALTILAVVNMLYLVFTKGGRKEFADLMMWPKDLLDVFHNMLYVAGLSKTEPRFGRYSYIEKFEYWGMWWGTFVMVVTGFCMWGVNFFLQHLPKIVLDVMALVHFYEAWLAVLVIAVWHLYYMIFDPHTYPMNWSWITGRITEEDFKARHPLEYEKVTGQPADTKKH